MGEFKIKPFVRKYKHIYKTLQLRFSKAIPVLRNRQCPSPEMFRERHPHLDLEKLSGIASVVCYEAKRYTPRYLVVYAMENPKESLRKFDWLLERRLARRDFSSTSIPIVYYKLLPNFHSIGGVVLHKFVVSNQRLEARKGVLFQKSET